ncbi:MAG TPA: DEAD/DEAH box helicase [Fimbriimonadaceae bacterium]|nr:DEAD/DEAH box helicase [Fimbriimonadaceae bacterium]
MTSTFNLSDDQEGALAEMLAENWRWGALFVTGPAGTGKSTVLRQFRLKTEANVVVVAPTGIAALSCGGQTIHRTFRFPPRFLRYRDPEDIQLLRGAAGRLLQKLDYLIIDEVSMVRSDVMDAIDWSLRINNGEESVPFGGKRVIVVGDAMQLPPVIRHEEAALFRDHWRGGFFFDANVWREAPLGVLELRTIHRQAEDPAFAEALSALRHAEPEGVEFLNSRVGHPAPDSQTIALTPRRDEADRINLVELTKLPELSRSYAARIDGTFPDSDMPTERELRLKVGAQVMIVANGRGFVNGMLGKVTELADEEVTVETQEGRRFTLERMAWERVQFELNGVSGKIEPRVAATFDQFPVRLAWATTIHKAQGLTLDRAHIEVGRGFFSHGQAYVALSRCRTAGGLTLSEPIPRTAMLWDRRVLAFRHTCEEEGVWRGGEWE